MTGSALRDFASTSRARVCDRAPGAWCARTVPVAPARAVITGPSALKQVFLVERGGRCAVRRRGVAAGSSGAASRLGFRRGAALALEAKDVRVASIRVAPGEVRVDVAGQHGVVDVIGVVQHELAQRPEVACDRVGPRAVGRRETPFDVVFRAPRLDLLGLCAPRGCRGSRRSTRCRGGPPDSS